MTPPVSFTVTSEPILELTKERSDSSDRVVTPGQAIAYRITVRNTGNMVARGVVVADPIDSARLTNPVAVGGSRGERYYPRRHV